MSHQAVGMVLPAAARQCAPMRLTEHSCACTLQGSISTSEDDKCDEAGGMVPAGRNRSVRAHPVEGSADSDFDVGVPGQAVRPSQRKISSWNMTNSQKVVKEGGLLLPFQAVVLTFKVGGSQLSAEQAGRDVHATGGT